MPVLIAFWCLLLGSVAAAYACGGRPERRAATMYLVAAVATVAVRPALSVRYAGVEAATFVIDVLLLLGLARVTSRSNRWWLICATALQGLTVLAHVGKLLNPNLLRLGYQMMATWAALPQLMLLALGVLIQAMRARRRAAAISPGYSRRSATTKRPATPSD